MISSSISRELESIRVRRAKLEALTASLRLPPLIPSDLMGPYSSSVLTHAPSRTYTGPRQVHRVRIGEHPPATRTPGGSAVHRPHSNRLPPLPTPPRTSFHNPLPKIGQAREMLGELKTGEDELGGTVEEPPSPESTPSPIVSPMSHEVPPGSGKRHSPAPSPSPPQEDVLSARNVSSPEVSEDKKDDERKTVIKQIVLEMAGGALPVCEQSDNAGVTLADSATTDTSTTATSGIDAAASDINTSTTTTNTNTVGTTSNTNMATTTTDTSMAATDTSVATSSPTKTVIDPEVNTGPATTTLESTTDTDSTSSADTETATKLAATVKARQLLSLENNPPIDDFLEAGVLKVAAQNLKHSVNNDLLFETAWVVTNIASGTSQQTQAVAEAGLIEPLVHLMESCEDRVKDQATWALANVAADAENLRNAVVGAGFLTPLVAWIRQKASIAALRNSTWALSNIFRLKDFHLTHEDMKLALDTLKEVCLVSEDKEVKKDALWCLKYMTQHTNGPIQLVVDGGVVPILIPFMKDKDESIVTVAAGIIGNIVSGTDLQTDEALEAGVVPVLHSIFKAADKARTRKEVAWALSNISAGTVAQIQMLLDDGVLPTLLEIIRYDEFEVVKEATWAVSNMAVGGSEKQVGVLVQHDVVKEMVGLLTRISDQNIIMLALTTLITMMEHDEHVEIIKDHIQECDGLDCLFEIKHNLDNLDASENARDILKKHFPDVDEPNEDDEADAESLTETASKYVPDE